MKKWYAKLNLVNKLRTLIFSNIIFSFVVLITIIAIIVSNNYKVLIDKELEITVDHKANLVKEMLEDAINATTMLNKYLISAFEELENTDQTSNTQVIITTEDDELVSNQSIQQIEILYQSEAYPQFQLTNDFTKIEEFILYNLWEYTAMDPNIGSMGIFFEPDAFNDLPYYGVYITKEAAINSNLHAFTDTNYTREEFYIDMKANPRPYIGSTELDDLGNGQGVIFKKGEIVRKVAEDKLFETFIEELKPLSNM